MIACWSARLDVQQSNRNEQPSRKASDERGHAEEQAIYQIVVFRIHGPLPPASIDGLYRTWLGDTVKILQKFRELFFDECG
jgi:hypothetical protein